jgi:hypothetical protein
MRLRLAGAVVMAGLMIAGCTTSSTSGGGKSAGRASTVGAFDADVLRALKDRDMDAFVQNLPPTTEPEKKRVDASYELPTNGGDGWTYDVLVHRSTRQVWIRRRGGGAVEVYGPTTMTTGR